MPQTTDRLREYLIPEEPLRGVYAATLSDDSSPKEVAVGVTDRRLLCLSDDGTFLNVGYDSICAIRSHQRSSFTYRGNDYRILLGSGALLAVLGFVALAAFASSPGVPVLALATVGAVAATAALFWSDDVSELATPEAIDRHTAADFDGAEALRRAGQRLPDGVEAQHALTVASAFVAVAGFLGTAAVATTPVVLLFFVPILGGIGLVDYGRRHVEELDGIEISRERARNVRIRTDDGRTVRLETDPSADVDRELSRLAFVDREESVQTVSARR